MSTRLDEARLREIVADDRYPKMHWATSTERLRMALEILELREDCTRTEGARDIARNLLQGVATALAKAVGAEGCPPVTAGNIYTVVDECLARVERLRLTLVDYADTRFSLRTSQSPQQPASRSWPEDGAP